MFGTIDQPKPSDSDVGVFIPERLLQDWHRKMQKRMPEVFTADDKIFGEDPGQHSYGTKLMTFLNYDPMQPMRCEVMGSRWKLETPFMRLPDNREPHYIVLINGELSQIALTSAHEESGWKVGWDRKVPTDTFANTNDDNYAGSVEGVVSRECIQCDNSPKCVRKGPQLRCNRCKIAYYCCEECKHEHRHEHLPYCKSLEEMHAMTTNVYGAIFLKESDSIDTKLDCSICDKDATNANPIIFPGCKHVFCLGCLESWPSLKEYGCPCCRAEKPAHAVGEEDRLFMRANFYAAKANSKQEGSGERRIHCDTALADIDEHTSFQKNENNLKFLTTKVHILNLHARKKHSQAAVDLAKRIVEIDKAGRETAVEISNIYEKYQTARNVGNIKTAERLLRKIGKIQNRQNEKSIFSDVFVGPLLLASTEGKAENWVEALKIYRELYLRIYEDEATLPQQRKIIMGITRCFYELGIYEKAINIGSAAVEMNRHFPGVHKYIALSHEASGDLDEAINTMRRAILYEAPWDDKNTAEIRNLLSALEDKKK